MALGTIAKNILLALQFLWGLIVALQLSGELVKQFADDPQMDDVRLFFNGPGFKAIATVVFAAIYVGSILPAYFWGGYWGFVALVPAGLAVLYQGFCNQPRLATCLAAVVLAGINAFALLMPAGQIFVKETWFVLGATVLAAGVTIFLSNWTDPYRKEA